MSLVTQPPGIATPLHRHTNEDEAFYLLDGTMTYRAGDETYSLAEGDFIWLPRGMPHAFRVTGSRPGALRRLRRPRRTLRPLRRGRHPGGERRLPGDDGLSMAVEIPRWNEVGPRYGLEVVGPPLPEEV